MVVLKNKKAFATAGLISFVYHLPYLIYTWTDSLYFLEMKFPIIKYITDFGEPWLHPHLFVIWYGFGEGFAVYLITYLFFFLTWYILYKLIIAMHKRMIKNK